MERLFGTDGIRGQANRYPVTPEVAMQIGKALGHTLGASGHGSCKAVIGKDTRLSGYMLETALTSGLVAMGVDVMLVGPVPTPAVAHLTRSMAADVGIMLTASHNPFDDNGIKIFGNDGFKISDTIEADITNHIASGELSCEHIRSDQMGKAYRIEDARGRYIEFAKSTIKSENFEGLKIVVDCANGAAYHIAPLILKELGAKVTKTFVEPDGYNINNLCGATHPEVVAKTVLSTQSDIGIAFDGDADRVIFCDAQGTVVDGDRILAMCALDFKARGVLKNNTLVTTTMSNMGLHEAMKNAGIQLDITDVGDRLVIDRMRITGANVGGEKSGHVILMDYATTGDGIITALQILRLMRRQGATLAQLAECMQEYPQQLVSIKVKQRKPIEAIPDLVEAMEACTSDLGVDGRLIVRYSGTEPKLRILIEARQADQVSRWIEVLSAVVRKELVT
ncbi:MAG: phosphoglucosamine mutase [bacterium]|jgi:phosphoglucosamine mutase